ncbi:CAP domain-containing protein [Micromonospora sp. WMMD1082]|uniref:CAP domain-containing protein n=1 Tax=Micromonospora sp. WMMD1082 TaxID=3016104 RepID=UPI00241753E6|nr:CAP domain-containing protein [Micromonospora sp. WMMD1082]MDG4792558.1 CAP domain-containing protein [Micromonospora sp. WMMD1082]
MHGWNDPIDPEHTPRRPEPPTDHPAWLTDRPAPRSSYLFGDEPESPSDGWYRDQPTEQWRPDDAHPYRATDAYEPAERSYPAAGQDRYDIPVSDTSFGQDGGRHHRDDERYRPIEPADGHYEPVSGHYEPADGRYGPATDGWSVGEHAPSGDLADDRTAVHAVDWTGHHAPHAGAYDAGRYDDQPGGYAGPDGWSGYGPPDAERPGAADVDRQGREPAGSGRRSRRLPRPLVMGGAAAAATLVVSLGVAALALPGDDTPANTTAGETPIATAPALPEEDEAIPFDTYDIPEVSPSPSVSPSTAAPSLTPSPRQTARPTPAPSRSTSPSRLGVDRQGSPSRGASASPSPTSGATSEAAQVVELVNAERAKAGCGALSIDEKLMTAAQRHSQDQADSQNMSHSGSDGSDPGERLDRVGYAWRTYGENVAWNQRTPAAVMDAWMNSSGHRANILNCAFTEIGVGVASSNGPYWTQVFAAPR